ncbi:hypothetical protein MD484_g5084, partial [Candolleomyces efflorescens]
MLALRTVAARRVVSRVPVAARSYTIGRSEGSVAESRGFNKKEKAHEDQYVHKHEAEQIAKLRAQIEAQEAEVAKLKEQEAELKANATKKQ